MTSSSSPGISLKSETISYIATAELPCVIVNIMRGGPGLGGIQPSQSDYFQATKGGGHGDYHLIVLAPSSVQEMYSLTTKAFQLAETYRNPVMIIGDGLLGQMMEPVEINDSFLTPSQMDKPWATTGCQNGQRRIINTLYLDPERLEEQNQKLQQKYSLIVSQEQMAESYLTTDAEYLLVAFGTTARIAKEAVEAARRKGIKAGLIRPITLWPFPVSHIAPFINKSRAVLTVEMNCGQMLEDVKLAVNGKTEVYFYGRSGGMVPSSKEILDKIIEMRDRSYECCS